VTGAAAVGTGVVIGSNAFNLAAMLGLSALVFGEVRIRREALLLEGGVALAATLAAVALVEDWLPAWSVLLLLAFVLGPYVAALGLDAEGLARVGVPRPLVRGVRRALGEKHREPAMERESPWPPLLLALPALAAIIGGSFGMVHTAVLLADRWNVPRILVGTLLLAGLTSLPNAFTGLRLARRHRGAALVSETMNSNTINIAGGLVVPALFVGLGPASGAVSFQLAWLAGMTALALALLWHGRGGSRGGLLLVLAYVVFVVVAGLSG
jgi:Ca2+/Na+ antiporter